MEKWIDLANHTTTVKLPDVHNIKIIKMTREDYERIQPTRMSEGVVTTVKIDGDAVRSHNGFFMTKKKYEEMIKKINED